MMHYIYITFKTPNRFTDFIFCTKKQKLCMVCQGSNQEKKSDLNFIFIFNYLFLYEFLASRTFKKLEA